MFSWFRSNTGNLYQRVPVDKDSFSIRVLDLLPGALDAEIKAYLRLVHLQSDVYYEALSYTWGGKSSSNKTITVNGKHHLPVTDNLYNALRRLRNRKTVRTLWVDQVCINQADLAERSSQVSQMGRIYSNAALVNVWLGEPKPDFDWSQIAPVQRSPADVYHKHRAIMQSAFATGIPLWHRRVWVFQEFVLARHIFFCCGVERWRFDQEWLEGLCAQTAVFSDLRFERRVTVLQRYRRLIDPAWFGEGAKQDIHEVLAMTSSRNLETGEPADYVYGFVGVLRPDIAQLIQPDYELPPAEIHARSTYTSIHTQQNCDIFDMVSVFSREQESESSKRFQVEYRYWAKDLPTWSVDFSRPKTGTGMAELCRSCRDPGHLEHCCLKKGLKAPSTFAGLDEAGRILTLAANLVDTVEGTLPLLNAASSAEPQTLESFIRNAIDSFTCSEPKMGLTPLLEASGMLTSPAKHVSAGGVTPKSTNRAAQFIKDGNISQALEETFNLWTDLNDQTGLIDPRGFKDVNREATKSRFSRMTIQLEGTHFKRVHLFATSSGAIGVGPGTVCKGDRVALVRSHTPFIAVRETPRSSPSTTEPQYPFQGQLFVHGFISEKVLKTWESLGFEEERIDLV